MPGISEGRTNAGDDVEWRIVGQADHALCRRHGVTHRVERFSDFLASTCQELGVLLLDVCRVGQHHGAEVAGGGGAIDRAGVAVASEQRKPAGVIDVCVREHDGVDLLDWNRELEILLTGLIAPALKHAAVEQDRLPVDAENVTGAGHLASSTGEFDLHACPWTIDWFVSSEVRRVRHRCQVGVVVASE